MRITENSLRRIVREEIIREAVKGGKMTLREGRRLMEQDGPPDLRDLEKVATEAQELSTLTGKSDQTEISLKSELVSKGVFDKDDPDMKSFQQRATGVAKKAADMMVEKYFEMETEKAVEAAKSGKRYAFRYKMDGEFPCKGGTITDLVAYAIPNKENVGTRVFGVIDRDGKRTNVSFYQVYSKTP